jgi:transcriptional regulator of acetoin/glycerol metabolism
MPLALQAALLRVMDTREVVPLGSNEARPVDANVVCATHRNLRALVDRGSFREDFYYRVAGHVFHIIPLRERRDFDAVLDAVLARLGWEPDRIPAAVRQRLRAAPWPGNVRQLQHAVQRALALAGPTSPVAVADLPPEIWSGANGAAEAEGVPAPGGWLRRATDEAIARALEQSGGDVTAAARLLGIGRATLYRRLARNRE